VVRKHFTPRRFPLRQQNPPTRSSRKTSHSNLFRRKTKAIEQSSLV